MLNDLLINLIFIFMIVIILGLLSPSGKYDKHIKLFISLLLVTSILSPVLSFLRNDDFYLSLMENQINIDQTQNDFIKELSEDNINNYISSDFKDRVCISTKDNLKKKYNIDTDVSVEVNEDTNSEKYGEIEFMEITVYNLGSTSHSSIKDYIHLVYFIDINNINIVEVNHEQ